jgi:glycolate oxidase FAD binding subunit
LRRGLFTDEAGDREGRARRFRVSTRRASPTDLAGALGPIVSAEEVGRFTVDGVVPAAAFRPTDYAEVAAVLSFANDNGLAVIPFGGGCHIQAGNLPARYDIALDLGALDRVVEFEPADLTITVQAGMTLGEVRRAAAAAGRVIPFDPGAPDAATVGGMIAAGVTGPAAASLGAPRDFTIGLRVVTADGRATRAGGKVVKNVAGYDLCKLYTGSYGTLGVIVEASLKALPAPPVGRRMQFVTGDVSEACSLVRSWFRAGLSLRSASVHSDSAGWLCQIVLAGTAAGVDRSYREISAVTTLHEAQTGDESKPDSSPLMASFTTPPGNLAALAADIAGRVSGGGIDLWPASGVCLLRADTGDGLDGALEAARAAGAAAAILSCPPDMKRDRDLFGVPAAAIDLQRRIKHEFDPRGTLSPGRGPGRV